MTASRPDFNDSSMLRPMKALLVAGGVVAAAVCVIVVDLLMAISHYQREYFNE